MAFGGDPEHYVGFDPSDIVTFRPKPEQGPWVSLEARIENEKYTVDFDREISIPRCRQKIAELKDGK